MCVSAYLYGAILIMVCLKVGVSFVSIFIVAYHIVFWVCGVARSLSWDYLPDIPQGEAAERRVPWTEKPIGSMLFKHILGSTPNYSNTSLKNDSKSIQMEERSLEAQEMPVVEHQDSTAFDSLSDPTTNDVLGVEEIRRTPSQASHNSKLSREIDARPTSARISESIREPSSILRSIMKPVLTVFNPITISLFIALPIALVPNLKALFVDISGDGDPKWKGPDGRPPLAFLMDTGKQHIYQRSHLN